jgi:porphobilinogen synthase
MARRDVRGTVEEVLRVSAQGVRAVMLFGVPSRKDPLGKGAWDPQGPVPRAIHALRRALPDLVIMADVCLCEYTDHGHCGVLRGSRVDNDRTLPLLARAAVTYVDAGADVVAPSAMMDHQVHAVREALDSRGFEEAMVLAYAAKFASGLYGPFRDAAGSRPSFGDRRSYQMDPRNAREALRELEQDEAEGADALMVKPALPNLDVLARARRRFEVPLAAYQVSGEYAMIKAAAAQGWLEESRVVPEILTSIQRAGADFILSYFAGELPLPAEETAA